MPLEPSDFEVLRKDLRQHRWAPAKPTAGDGEILLGIDTFALTANNITYAVFGEAMKYWDFFPAPAPWGHIPVWGYATVLQSRAPGVEEGERVYGYLPMSTHAVLRPGHVSAAGFIDVAGHRRELAAAYQQYTRLAADPMHDARFEDHRALLHPLYFTSFLIEDFLRDKNWFGAQQVVLASASSKTALGVAFLAKKNGGLSPISVVGLTSPRNKKFCEDLGYYDQVVTYDQLATLQAAAPTVYIDMAGDGKLLSAVHHHFGDALKYSCIVGATHWEERATQHSLPGAKPQFFFAPTHVALRVKDWGWDAFRARLGESWKTFLPSVNRWLEIRHSRGTDACAATYLEVLDGRAPPQAGHVLSFRD